MIYEKKNKKQRPKRETVWQRRGRGYEDVNQIHPVKYSMVAGKENREFMENIFYKNVKCEWTVIQKSTGNFNP